MSNLKKETKQLLFQIPKKSSKIQKKTTKSSRANHNILMLQKSVGNQAVQQLMKNSIIQAKHTTSQSNNKYEEKKEKQEKPRDKAIEAIAKATLIMFLKTSAGKSYKKKLLNFLNKPVGLGIPIIAPIPKKFVLAGIGGTSLLSYMFAKNMNMPQGLISLVPKVVKLDINQNLTLSVQPIFKGKLNKPKELGGILNLTINF